MKSKCTFAGNRKFMAEELYEKFKKDTFTSRDVSINPKSLRSLEQSGILVMVERRCKEKPNVYRLSEMALTKLGDDIG